MSVNLDVVRNFLPSAYYSSEFITPSEEEAILANVYAVPKPKWTQLSNRRLQNWGGIPHARGMVAESVPPWLAHWLAAAAGLSCCGSSVWRARPNHVLVNEYRPGQGIMPHLDGALFHPTIATLSLGSHTVLRFAAPDGQSVGALLLEPRSLLVLRDELYTRYMHHIEEVTEDLLDASIANLDSCADKYVRGTTISRDTRVSLTIRHVPKTTAFKLNIGIKR